MTRILATQDLSDAETSLLATIIRLSSDLAGKWHLGEPKECDALFVEMTDSMNLLAAGTSRPVRIPVCRRGETIADEGVLKRPIRAEDVIRQLMRVEALLSGAQPAASVPAPAAPASNLAARGKLLRWPTHALLAASRTRVQMATMLSRRAMSASELSVTSGLPLQECETFMAELGHAQMLEWQAVAAQPGAGHAPASNDAHATARPKSGLFMSIRKRLGLA